MIILYFGLCIEIMMTSLTMTGPFVAMTSHR